MSKRRWWPVLLALCAVRGVAVGAEPQQAASAPRYTVTELPAPDGATMLRPMALNDHGQVVGLWTREAPGIKPRHHSFLWDRGELKDLGPLEAWDLNNQGQVVGRWIGEKKGEDSPAALWREGKLTLLDLFPESVENSSGYAINHRGQVLGNGYTDQPFRRLEFLMREGKVQDLRWVGRPVATVGTTAVHADAEWRMHQGPGALNNRGQVAGTLTRPEKDPYKYPITHAGVWTDGQVTDLGTLPGYPHSRAVALNDHGVVIGEARPAHPPYVLIPEQRAVIWTRGKIRALDLLPGGDAAQANALNNQGQVVGGAASQERWNKDGSSRIFHAVLWQQGKVLDLNDLLPSGSKVLLLGAVDINERGQILCKGMTSREGQRRAYLLSPQR